MNELMPGANDPARTPSTMGVLLGCSGLYCDAVSEWIGWFNGLDG
jgi:hypothetical protein